MHFTSSETYGGTGTERPTTVTTFSGFQYTNGYNAVGYLDQITDANSGAVYWTANTMDASGDLTEETAGNGVVTNRAFWPQSGRVEQIEAETSGAPPGGAATIANLSYSWDTIGNLVSRNDTVNGVAENFCYLDNAGGTANVLNRLSGYSVGSADASCTDGSLVKSMGYDNDGNIAQKSDIGGYTYGQGGAGPHALSSIATNSGVMVDGVANPSFTYDADGNMLCVNAVSGCTGAARSYGWTSFDKVASIAQGASGATLAYDPEHNRGSLTATGSGNTTWYFANPAAGSASELLSGATSTWRDYLVAYGKIVAERFNTGGTPLVYYFVGDHLASTTALTDLNEARKEYDSYDAWGKRRYANGTDASGCGSMHPTSLTLRGFTGEEEMDNFCLVNLNARMYDPSIGRMLSADPTVPDPTNGQAFNRYSYVINNPLALVDPSGLTYELSCTAEGVCHIICVECMTGNGMPDWGASGQGVWGIADDGSLISMEDAQFAFSNGISPDALESDGFVGAVAASGVLDNYTWLDQIGNSCTPGSGTSCWGIPGVPAQVTNSIANNIQTLTYTGNNSGIIFGWNGASNGFMEWNGVPGGGLGGDPGYVGESSSSLSMGVIGSISSIPFTSGGGATFGKNYQYVGGSSQQWYQFNGGGTGLNVGVSIQSSWAWGSGQWTGQFDSVNVSIGFMSGSVYWTPGPGGWVGFSFGFSAGLPGGLSYEAVNYSNWGGF